MLGRMVLEGSSSTVAWIRRIDATPAGANESRMNLDRRFCIAPMMEWTDRHCRFFHRLLTRRALIYTEMITTGAVLHGERARLLAHDPAEHPAAICGNLPSARVSPKRSAMTRLTSMSVVPRIVCRWAASAPV